MKTLLDVNWENLLVATYRVDAAILEPHLPAGTELDTYHGEHFVSIVAFEFKKTKIAGIPIPFYRSFAEINLRFYVRRKVDGEWRRGVVFVKEIVPCRIPALIARYVFHENFHVHPLRCEQANKEIRYTWLHNGEKQEMSVDWGSEFYDPEQGSLNEHVIEHYWAYKRLGPKVSGEFQVSHRSWKIRECDTARIQVDIAHVYGLEWAAAMDADPVSLFLADGSRVSVTRPQKFNHSQE